MKNGFTLLELLIVIGILAVLATVVTLVLNPIELMKQSRDSKRLAELKTIDSALNLYLVSGGNSFGSSNVVYISLSDTSPTCASYSLPVLPSGWLYNCKSETDYRKIDGNGWIPVDFINIPNPPLATLPVDPQNNKDYYYAYVSGGSWAITSLLESEKYLKQFALADGGTDSGRFETGSDLQLWINASGLQGYWKFDEGSGTTALDLSGNNNIGTLTNGPVWTTGKINGALSLDGTNDYVNIPALTGNLNINTNPITIEAWIYPKSFPASGTRREIVGRGESGVYWDGYGVSLNGNNINLGVHGGGNFLSVVTLTANQWYHVVGIINGASSKIYINGIADSATGNINVTTSSYNATIGSAISSPGVYGNYFNGFIDEVKIYNRVLSDAEIQSIYNAEK